MKLFGTGIRKCLALQLVSAIGLLLPACGSEEQETVDCSPDQYFYEYDLEFEVDSPAEQFISDRGESIEVRGLPPGLSFDGEYIVGIPTEAGETEFTMLVTIDGCETVEYESRITVEDREAECNYDLDCQLPIDLERKLCNDSTDCDPHFEVCVILPDERQICEAANLVCGGYLTDLIVPVVEGDYTNVCYYDDNDDVCNVRNHCVPPSQRE